MPDDEQSLREAMEAVDKAAEAADESTKKRYKQAKEAMHSDSTRFPLFPTWLKAVFGVFSVVGIGLACLWILGYPLPFTDTVLLNYQYYYILFGIFEGFAFLLTPMRKADRGRLPWYDFIFAGLTMFIGFYVAYNAWEIATKGWVPAPDTLSLVLGSIFCLLCLEGGRRLAGPTFTIVCLVFAGYPMFADWMPGILQGVSKSPDRAISEFVYGSQGMIGLPGQVLGDFLIGFLLFAGVLLASGAATFFLDFAMALCGGFRGGPAKVAVIASGLFGSLSGAPITNVAAVGTVTIPAMKKMGYPGHYAGAIEACASTGGVIMPPVMGSVAFMMAFLIGVPYGTIAVAAVIPACLYYFALLMQVDAYAARSGLVGLPKSEVPRVLPTFLRGWVIILVLVIFVVGLLVLRLEYVTPIYGSGALIIFVAIDYLIKKVIVPKVKGQPIEAGILSPGAVWRGIKALWGAVIVTGKLVTQTMSLLLPAAFIIGGFITTGVAASLTSGFVDLGGGNEVIIIIAGIVVCLLLGMIGIGGYLFLAVTMAPALVQKGFNEIGIHLFIIYYTILAGITPPVCTTAFVGAAIAQAPPMKTGMTAMRLGIVLLFVPVFFLYDPALLIGASGVDGLRVLYVAIKSFLGILFISGGLEGYLWFIGRIPVWLRLTAVVGGFVLAMPGDFSDLIGAIILAATVVLGVIFVRIPGRNKAPAKA